MYHSFLIHLSANGHLGCFHVLSSVQLLSRAQLFVTPWIAEHQASLSITNSRNSPKIMSIESVVPSSVIPFSSCPQSLPASGSTPHMKWPKY